MSRDNLQQVRCPRRSRFLLQPPTRAEFLCLCRYKCPAYCTNKKGKVWGTVSYDVVSPTAPCWGELLSPPQQNQRNPDGFGCVSNAGAFMVPAIEYLQSCHPRRRHRRQRGTRPRHQDGQAARFCPIHEKRHRVVQVERAGSRNNRPGADPPGFQHERMVEPNLQLL